MLCSLILSMRRRANRKLNLCFIPGFSYDPSLGWGGKGKADSLTVTDQMVQRGFCSTPQVMQKPNESSDVSLLRNPSIIPRSRSIFQGFFCGIYKYFNLTIQRYFRSNNDNLCAGRTPILTHTKVFIIIRKNICNFNLQ